MAKKLPLQTSRPVKIYEFRVEYKLDDNSSVELVDPAAREAVVAALNKLATVHPGEFPAGRAVLSITIDIGNHIDIIVEDTPQRDRPTGPVTEGINTLDDTVFKGP